MTTDLRPCASCARHVKGTDGACPFCLAPIAAGSQRRLPAPRTSRAGWLALSTMTLLGCSGNVDSSSAGQTGSEEHTSATTGCATRSGYFSCGGNVCDRSVQACVENDSLCASMDALTSYTATGAKVQCGECPTCACVQKALRNNCVCQQDDAGSLVISCGGCYGAPPARLERLF